MDVVDLIQYPGYKVDRNGNVYGKNGSKLKPSKNHNGYNIVNMMINGQRIGVSVHTLIASTFIPNPECKNQVNHKDGNKTNNQVENLEWMTASENMQHAIQVLGFKPAEKQRRKVQAVSLNDCSRTLLFDTINDAGRWINTTYGVNSGNAEVWKAMNGLRKSARGYLWSYAS